MDPQVKRISAGHTKVTKHASIYNRRNSSKPFLYCFNYNYITLGVKFREFYIISFSFKIAIVCKKVSLTAACISSYVLTSRSASALRKIRLAGADLILTYI